MRLPDDDEMYMVDQTYLGPPGRYLGTFRYKAIGALVVLAPLAFVVMRRTGLPLNLLTVGLTTLLVLRAASWFADHSTSERPVASLFRTARNELTAGRQKRRGDSAHAANYQSTVRPRGPLGRWVTRQREGANQ